MSERKTFIIGVEEYQRGEISKVDFAEADAQAVADALKYSGLPEDNIIVLLSATATKTTIESKLRTFMMTVSESDLMSHGNNRGSREPLSKPPVSENEIQRLP